MNEVALTALIGRSLRRRAPLRESVLRGAYFGSSHHGAAAGRVAEFPYLATAEALRAWFGPDFIRLACDLEACRGALDRDIAAIDDAIGEQLDAILHHPRLRRFEGSWRGLAGSLAGLSRKGGSKSKS